MIRDLRGPDEDGGAELRIATEIFVESVRDLARRNGQSEPPFTVENRLPLYAHIHRTGGFKAVEREGKVVAVACGIARGSVWFLSGFWARPGHQGQGLGRPLLEALWDEARQGGARVFFTWSSIDFAALATYLKLGMNPLGQVISFAGSVSRPPPADLSLELGPLDVSIASEVDSQVRGAQREQDHALWKGQGTRVARAGRTLGYFYLSPGALGPVAWLSPDDGPAVLAAALGEAGRAGEPIRLVTTALVPEAIRAALESGLQISGTAHLLSTESFGRLNQYLPSGPLLF